MRNITELEEENKRLFELSLECERRIELLRATLQQIQVMAENGNYGIAALAKETLCSTQ